MSGLKEVIRRADGTDQKLHIRDAAEKAHRRIICGGEFPSQLVMQALILGCQARKASRLHETCLSCVQHIAYADCLAKGSPIEILGRSTTIGVALVEALLEVLVHSDAPAQIKALDCFSLCLDEVKGQLQVRAILCCFNLSLASGSTSHVTGASPLHLSSSGMLTTLLHRVVTQFVADSVPSEVSEVFSCTTVLDFFGDADPMDKYVELAIPLVAKRQNAAATSSSWAQQPSSSTDLPGASSDTNTATLMSTASQMDLRQSVEFSASGVMNNSLPPSLRDLLLVLKNFCIIASRGIATSSLQETSIEVRTRLLALKMILLIFSDLPAANCESEHRCAAWLSSLFSLAKYDLLRSLARNIATVVPGSFFSMATEIIGLLMSKFHYHAHEELAALLALVVFPLASSKLSTFNQKFDVLVMIRRLVESPSLLVSYFINYDCNPLFDARGKFGGMLEMLLQFVCDMMFATVSHLGSPTLSSTGGIVSPDQEVMLRCECVRIIHDVTASFRRWLFDDPKAKSSRSANRDGGGAGGKFVEASAADDAHLLNSQGLRATELFLDDWSSEDGDESGDDHDTSIDGICSRDEGGGSFAMAMSPAAGTGSESDSEKLLNGPSATPAPVGNIGPFLGMGRRKNIRYHWKHIHQQLCNKKILHEAAARFNTNWRHGRTYLVDRGVISENDLLSFARFLRSTPTVDRKMLCSVFEKVTKDEQCVAILRTYLSTFDYRGVPIDVALRDTTCEFMSWDRPQFEAQVWDKIQGIFGEEYARQNEERISARDADVMAGVLLFLHTSLHNANARSAKMTIDQFVRDGSACLIVPPPVEEMKEIFARVASRRWGLDSNARNPRQQEIAESRKSTVAAAAVADAAAAATTKGTPTTSGGGGLEAALAAASNDDVLLSEQVRPYADDLDRFRLSQQAQQEYVRTAQELLIKLENEVRESQEQVSSMRQPYIVPHFAQHVRPMLLLSYPQLAACAYLGLRILRHEPILRLILDFYQNVMDVAAAFVLNLSDLHTAVERTIQQGLRVSSGAAPLGHIRVSLAPFFMNRV